MGSRKWLHGIGKGSGYVFSGVLSAMFSCMWNGRRSVPAMGKSQGRGNSGVFLMGQYEIQVLDSYENETYADGQAASVYGQYPPLVNVCRPPGEWQSYDIVFRRPRFDRRAGCSSLRESHSCTTAFWFKTMSSCGGPQTGCSIHPTRRILTVARLASGPRKSRALSKHLAARASRME